MHREHLHACVGDRLVVDGRSPDDQESAVYPGRNAHVVPGPTRSDYPS
ncbi:MAG: hypothetical protein ACXWDI_01015 [Nocardioides sp.]